MVVGDRGPTRVLLVVGTFGAGGAERQLRLFAEHVGTRAELHVFALDTTGPHAEAVRGAATSFHEAGPRPRLRRAARFLSAVRAVRPHVIHCWHTFPIVYPALTRHLHRRPVAVNVRGELTRDADTGLERMHPAARWLKSADTAISNSAHSLDALIAAGVSVPRPQVIPNGIVVPAEARGPRAAEAPLRLLGIGTLKELKNWPWLLRVAARLRSDGHAIDLRILGDGPDRASLSERARSLGLAPECVFPGFVADVQGELQRADILVHPSRTEGQPNAVLEALAAGIPAVTTALPVCEAIASEPGAFVRTAPLDDDAALARALTPWLEDDEARRAAGTAGRAWVEATLGVETMVGRYLEVYDRLRSTRRPSP